MAERAWTTLAMRKGDLANATELMRKWGYIFYEDPVEGDEGTILAAHLRDGPDGPVYDTNDFDLPEYL